MQRSQAGLCGFGKSRATAVVILAATNRPDVLDPALLRPGRFDRQVAVGLPDRPSREAILRIHSQATPLAPDVDLGVLARGTAGFSGADLANLVNEAAIQAAHRHATLVTMADFEKAQDRIVMGGLTGVIMSDEERRGRAAEELVFKESTTGAEDDLRQATALARQMVAGWGMSPEVGLITVDTRGDVARPPGATHEYSEQTAGRIDQEIARLIADAYGRAANLLQEHRATLDRLAEMLIREDVVDASALAHLAPHPASASTTPGRAEATGASERRLS